MARYAVPADMTPTWPQYLRTQILDDNHDGVEDPGLAELLLEEACDYIDGYIAAAGYLVPITGTTPVTVHVLAKQVAYLFAHQRLNIVDERIARLWEQVRADLAALVAGALSVGLTPAPAGSGSTLTDSIPYFASEDRVWSRDATSGW